MVKMTFISEYLAKYTFVKSNEMPALTGISRKMYDLLLERPLLSFEIKSADNINALLGVEEGALILLTPSLREDLLPNAQGIICELRGRRMSLQKVKKWDEVEIVTARIQVKPMCIARVTAVKRKNLGEGVIVDVERAIRCSIS